MARQGRNERCACNSGRKYKRCCGRPDGASAEASARAFLQAQAELAARAAAASVDGDVVDELLVLPLRHPELLCRLPVPEPPVYEEARRALRVGDHAGAGAALRFVLPQYDSAIERERLAKVVVRLQTAGQVSEHLAAVAYLDLAQDSGSLLVRCSLAAAVAADEDLLATAS